MNRSAHVRPSAGGEDPGLVTRGDRPAVSIGAAEELEGAERRVVGCRAPKESSGLLAGWPQLRAAVVPGPRLIGGALVCSLGLGNRRSCRWRRSTRPCRSDSWAPVRCPLDTAPNRDRGAFNLGAEDGELSATSLHTHGPGRRRAEYARGETPIDFCCVGTSVRVQEGLPRPRLRIGRGLMKRLISSFAALGAVMLMALPAQARGRAP